MVDRPEQVRILIVSASAYVRYVVSGELSPEPDLFVVGTARTPEELAHKRAMLRPDLVVADIETPQDLLELKRTSTMTGLPVLALCAHNQEGAKLAFAALEAGVVDVLAHSKGSAGAFRYFPDLVYKVRGLARVKPRPTTWEWPPLTSPHQACPRPLSPGDRLVVVSGSTGGVGPLVRFLVGLPLDMQAAVLVLLSLPLPFLDWLLRRVDPATAFRLRGVHDGVGLNNGVAHFAVFGYQTTVGPNDRLALERTPSLNGSHASADVTLSSMASRYGPAVVAVILSGIGQDGVRGALDVRAAGGIVIVQEETTCLAPETPRAVVQAGAATLTLPPEQIVTEIVRCARNL